MDLKAVAPPAPSPVPRELLDGAETVTGALAALARRCPDFECLILVDGTGDERRITLASLWSRARDVQSALQARGVAPGEFVVIALPTGPELVSAYFGVMLAGAVPGLVATPSNRVADARVYTARVGAILANAGARVLLADDEVAALFAGEAAALGAATIVTPDMIGHTPSPPPAAAVRGEDIGTIQYSSGATGTPNGVLLTHRAILNNVRALRDGLGLTRADVSVNWIPLYHDMGLIDAFLLPLLNGCPTVLIPTMDFMRDPSLWLWAIHHYRGAHAWAPNFAYALCAKRIPDEDVDGLDLSSWRIAVSAAEPILADTVRSFTTRFAPYGLRAAAVTPVYGLAENVTAATCHPVDQAPRVETIDRHRLAADGIAAPIAAGGLDCVAAGRCLPGCTIEIRDEDRRVLPDRHVGNIWLDTNCLFSGYHRQPELTAQTLVDGWLDTGDRGYLADGDLYFVSREKDLVVVGGEKYAPHDVEVVINRVPGVREGCAVVFGVLSADRGTEDVAAVVETRETTAEAQAALRDAIRRAVASATGLGLRHVLLVPPGGVEKTTSGKLARRATSRRYAAALAGDAGGD